MKTLIATLALALAASTSAFAGDIPSEAGIPLSLQSDNTYNSAQVSGFTGVSAGTFMAAMGEPGDRGLPLNLQDGNEDKVFGFTGIQSPASYVIEHSPYSN